MPVIINGEKTRKLKEQLHFLSAINKHPFVLIAFAFVRHFIPEYFLVFL